MELRALGSEHHPVFGPDGGRDGHVRMYLDPGGAVVALTDAERDERDPRWRREGIHGTRWTEPKVTATTEQRL